ncbi:MAG: hypothetical protein JNL08_05950 [Planctomycetes bacterium]|nr:hypothetical protein [Planctomycetota bacterium]
MPAVQVKKVVVVCFLEATKMTLEHLAAYRLELTQRPTSPSSPDLARLYGELRRLRDYLQRCASAYQDNADLDLSTADQGLLVACCRRGVESIDHRLVGDQLVNGDEKRWLQKKRQVLADWAVELAEKPLVELPMPRVSPTPTEGGRALLARLQQKLFGDVANRQKIRAPTSGINSVTAGVRSFGDEFVSVEPPPEDDDSAAAPARAGFGLPEVVDEIPQLVSSSRFHEPRLRALVAMDLAALARARTAKDWRLATVLLAAVVEAAVLDHAMARRAELALTTSPDTWNVQDLLVQLMGDALSPKDRAHVYHLFASRNLLRPALQLTTPTVVTQATFDRVFEFAQRAAHHMGFGGGTRAAGPASAAPAPDAPEAI